MVIQNKKREERRRGNELITQLVTDLLWSFSLTSHVADTREVHPFYLYCTLLSYLVPRYWKF